MTPEWAALVNERDQAAYDAKIDPPGQDGLYSGSNFQRVEWYKDVTFRDQWRSGSARSEVLAKVAPFDHDGDGYIDLSDGSNELTRDRAGGPVTSRSRGVDVLVGYKSSDTDGDGKLSPEEATVGYVNQMRRIVAP